MKKKASKIFGSFLVFIGVMLILGALGLTAYNYWEDYQAQSSSDEIVRQLESIRMENTQQQEEISSNDPFPEEEPDPNRDMPTVEIDGYRYIGTLTIPPLELEFPVTEEWDYERMKIATCRYSGTVYLNDLVICAHNYNNFFRKLDKLQKEDVIIFTDVEGNSYEYRVAETEVLVPTAIEEMKTGDWDLTLFTCNYWGDARVAVRCDSYEK